MLLHLAVLTWVPVCTLACWWQVTVALAGDSLGWLYSVEWPAFGLFGIVVWWNLIHDDPTTVGARALRRSHPPLVSATSGETTRRADDEDEALAAYNDYLEGLAAPNRPKGPRLD